MPRQAARQRTLVGWGLVLAWAGVIWALSSIPDLRSGLPEDLVLRKIAHALEFGVLALLVRRALPQSLGRAGLREGYAATLALAYALVDEVHQSTVLGRHGAATDVLIDGSGILLAMLLIYVWRYWRRP